MSKNRPSRFHGMLNVYKEPGYTSHDVVAKLRGILGQQKIGHTGTLDPAASGVLPVCLGAATRAADMLAEADKEYTAALRLGVTTDTQDMTGQILSEKPVTVSEDDVRTAILHFTGTYAQVPPMYSALKVNGQKLYDLARQGKEVERAPRTVTISEARILSVDLPLVRFHVTCSKGTYIRTLCADIGEYLGCGGAMETLERTRVGMFTKEESLTLAKVQELVQAGDLPAHLQPIEDLFPTYPKVKVTPEVTGRLQNGNTIPCEMSALADGTFVRMYDADGEFYGIYRYVSAENALRCVKMFPTGE